MGLVDSTFKEMALTSFPELVNFLMPGLHATDLIHLPQELPATARSVDILLKALGHPLGKRLLILECQAQRDPELQKLLLLRAALAHFFYDWDVSTLVLALTKEAVVPEVYRYGYAAERPLVHEVEVRKLYEEPAELALDRAPPAILPLCPVMYPRDGDRGRLLEQTVLKIARTDLPLEKRRLLTTWASTFVTLHMPKVQVELIINELARRRPYMLQPLRDLPLLRDIFHDGKVEGKTEGQTETLRGSIMDLCEVLGIDVSQDRRAQLEALDMDRLITIRDQIKRTRSWEN